jgi:hypothetical protein
MAGGTHRSIRTLLTSQPLEPAIVLLPFAIGYLGAAATGLTVGFDGTDDPVVAQVRLVAPLLTGAAAGLVGRGLWGWLAVAAGAVVAISLATNAMSDPVTLVTGWTFLSLPALAPGYAAVRLVARVGWLARLDPARRASSLRGSLRLALRGGVVLTGAAILVAELSAMASADGPDEPWLRWVVWFATVGLSYGMYRLVAWVDRGEQRAAMLFTVVYGLATAVLFGMLLSAQETVTWQPVAAGVFLVLVPGLFMALGPWVLVRGAEQEMPPRTAGQGGGPGPGVR